MRYSLAIAALAATVAAIPTNYARDAVVEDVEVDTVVDIVTDIVTVVGNPPAATPTPAAQSPAPHDDIVVVTVAAKPTPAPAPVVAAPAAKQQEVQPQSSPSSAPSSSGSSGAANDGSPIVGGKSLLQVANQYRSLYGLSDFTWDPQLAANSQKTANDDGGSQEHHELNSGSLAQVLTPGNWTYGQMGLTPFEVAYVGGWLCEEPVPQLNGICSDLDKAAGLDVSGDVEHAQILRNPNYHHIGCAWAANGPNGGSGKWTGLWSCDLS